MSRGSDNTKQDAKPVAHDDTDARAKHKYEHKEITDNRLLWEVLEASNQQ